MNIQLKPETAEWLKAQVAKGRYASIEDAVEKLVGEARRNQAILDSQDWSWSKPYIEQGIAALEAAGVVPTEDMLRDLLARMKTFEQKWIIE